MTLFCPLNLKLTSLVRKYQGKSLKFMEKLSHYCLKHIYTFLNPNLLYKLISFSFVYRSIHINTPFKSHYHSENHNTVHCARFWTAHTCFSYFYALCCNSFFTTICTYIHILRFFLAFYAAIFTYI